jgi:hypothetical protein
MFERQREGLGNGKRRHRVSQQNTRPARNAIPAGSSDVFSRPHCEFQGNGIQAGTSPRAGWEWRRQPREN